MATSLPSSSDFESRLAMLASLAVNVAVNLRAQQELVVSAPIEAAALVPHVASAAYRRGARHVTCVYEDPALIRTWLESSSIDRLDYAPTWISNGVVAALQAGAARLRLLGPYPDLLAGIAAERVLRAHGAWSRSGHDEARLTAAGFVNASALPVATGAWARQAFPELGPSEALNRLWDTLFEVLRMNAPDPQGAWEAQRQRLNARRDALQSRCLVAVRFFDGRTDLTVGLAPDHQWIGGSRMAANGVEYFPALPAEELFTTLDGRTAAGRVCFTRPLALGGTTVRGLQVEFAHGAVIKIEAIQGGDVFERLIGNDAGRRLGEVGLVARSSPVAGTSVQFWNPLLDRNAACHVTFGLAPPNQPEGDEKSDSPLAPPVRVDCMMGEDDLNVDGVDTGRSVVPIMRRGEFVL